MTCRVIIRAPYGSTAEASTLLDSGSSASFNSCLRSRNQNHGIAGLIASSPIQAIANFDISPMHEETQHDSYRRTHMTCLFIQSSATLNGSTHLAYIWPIHTSFMIQEELISSEWKSSLKSCVKAGGTDLWGHQSQLNLSSAQFLQGRSVFPLTHRTSHFTTIQSPLMRYCRSFGKLRRD